MRALPEAERPTLGRIYSTYFSSDQSFPLVIREGWEGQTVNELGQFVLGCRAGPDVSVVHLLHEMAHFAEREVEKLLERPRYSWGFRFGTLVEIPAINYSQRQLQKVGHIDRELRVFAYQYNLCREFQVKMTSWELANICKYLENFCSYGQNPESPFKNEEERILIAEAKLMELASTYTVERFSTEWWHRVEALSKGI